MTLAQYDMLQRMAEIVWGEEELLLTDYENDYETNSAVWSDHLIKSPRDKGIVTSMIRGGLVTKMGSDRLSTVRMTKKGFEEWNAARKSKS